MSEKLPLGGSRTIPKDWTLYSIDELKSPNKYSCVAGPFGSNISSKYFVEEGIPVIRGKNLKDDMTRFIAENFVYVSEDRAKKYKSQHVKAHDLVFTCWGTIGQVGIIPQDGPYEEYIISNKQLKLRVNEDLVSPLFLYYYLSSREGVNHIKSRATGSAVPGINLGILKSFKVAIPDLKTQSFILKILSNYDDLINNNNRRIALLEESVHRLYREWFVHLRFPGHEQVAVVDGVPEGWEKVSLDQALILQRGFDLPKRKRKSGIVPIYASTGVNGFHGVAKVKGPGVVTGRSGTLGTVMYVHNDFWPLNTALWIKEFRRVTASVAYFLLCSMDLASYQGGAAVPTLNRNAVHAVEILLPLEALQVQFDLIAVPTLDQIQLLTRYNQQLREARDRLLPRLMNGTLTV